MFYITQSNDIERLFEFLLKDYQQKSDNIFEAFTVIVPAKVMGEWLKKQVADRAGISTLVVTEFWGRYQWTLMQKVLKRYASQYPAQALRVPDVAMLSRNVMQWRLFGYFNAYQGQILANPQHSLYPLLEPLSENYSDNPSENPLNSQAIGQRVGENGNVFTQLLPSPAQERQASLGQDNRWLYTPSFLAKPLRATSTDKRPTVANLTKLSLHQSPDFSHGFVTTVLDSANQTAQQSASEQRLWQLAGDMAGMLSRYMTYRPDWLASWATNQPLPVETLMQDKAEFFAKLSGNAEAELPPEWLVTHYTQLEIAQRFLWQTLFAQTYAYRQQIEAQFWHALAHSEVCRQTLPKELTLFTIQLLPQSELTIMRQLARYMDIKLLHYNPSALFWADIVDKDWLLSQQFLRPETVYLKDYGHTLLSRFGKQSREIFAMLADLSGNEDMTGTEVIWQDEFVENDEPTTVLAQLQQDILMLEEQNTALKIDEVIHQLKQRQYRPERHWQLTTWDNSLSIHACHGILRQLEVLRSLIIGWLNYVDAPKLAQGQQEQSPAPTDTRQLSDILILLPDIEAQQPVIEAVFPAGKGADGYVLPAKVTGVLSKDINQLWSAIIGFFVLHTQPTSRFERNQVFDWLMLPAVYESYQLNQPQMARACDLLQQAGFIRGFDEIHLQQSLHEADDDYRFSFAFALERLVAGVLMPQATSTEFGEYLNQHHEREKVLPLPQMQLSDSAIVAALCDIYQTLARYRDMAAIHQSAEAWLEVLESFIHEKFSAFEQTTALKAIWSARNSFYKNISANKRQQNNERHQNSPEVVDSLPLQLGFILSSMQAELASQQVSAEPAGVITFGRLGALRNLPYKLVVLLDMNLANFPKRDVANRYDLMQVGIGRRGDRFREDDDLGAFLEAILAAKEACWLFYDRASLTQTQEQLPASPVQELISFLQSEVHWQNPDLSDPATHAVATPLSQDRDTAYTRQQLLRAWLITQHPMLPFDPSYFQTHNAEPQADTDSDADTLPQPAIDMSLVASSVAQSPLTQLKDSKKSLYPAAKLWYHVYEQLAKPHQTHANHEKGDTGSSHISDMHGATDAPTSIWQKDQLSHWLNTWRQQQHASQDHAPTSAIATQTLPAPATLSQLYLPLSQLIAGLQKPAQLFLNAQQIYLPTTNNDDSYLEPLELTGLTKFALNKFLLNEVIDSSLEHDPTSRIALMPFDNQLPAGVKRYESLASQKIALLQAIHTLFSTLGATQQRLFPEHRQIAALIEQVLSPATDSDHHRVGDNMTHGLDDPQAPQRDLSTDSEKLFATTQQLMTPCAAQRVAIDIVGLQPANPPTNQPTNKKSGKNAKNPPMAHFSDTANFPDGHRQSAILTANLPVPREPAISPPLQQNPKSTANDTGDIMPEYWFNYLPTNGREKYLIEMWLHHLCWQVARQTTPDQVTRNDGMSLWQFSHVKLLYLPPIVHTEAYQYLQDWLMVWQLAQRTVIVLPPSITAGYIAATCDGQLSEEKQASQRRQLFQSWLAPSFNSHYISEDCAAHPSWQFLLGKSAESTQTLQDFIVTLGQAVYQPLLKQVQDLTLTAT